MAGAFDILAGMDYVSQRGEQGRKRGEQTFANRLLGEAYNATGPERENKLGALAKTQPGMAMDAGQQFGQMDDQRQARRKQLVAERAQTLSAMDAATRMRAWPAMRQAILAADPELGQALPEMYDDATFAPVLQQLAGQGGGGEMFSQKIGADGFIYNTDRSGRITNTGVKADRQAWFANNPGVDPYLVGKGGEVTMVGGGQPGGMGGGGSPQPNQQPAGQRDYRVEPNPGAEIPESPADLEAMRLAMTQGGTFRVENGRVLAGESPGLRPPTQQPVNNTRLPSIMDIGGGDPAFERSGGNSLRRPAPAPAGSAPPSGYRPTADGSALEFIPGGPADPANKPMAQDKPLPVGALRLQLEAEEALTGAEGVIDELDRIDQQLTAGTLDLGFFSNLGNKAKNAAGMSDEESRAFGAFTATLERLRNESLRLNKGVQTEGDSQRAWNELIADINDGKNVQEQIKRIQRYNRRAVELQQRKKQAVEQNYQGKAASDSPEDDIDALLAEFGG
jgi:hypothetical protein